MGRFGRVRKGWAGGYVCVCALSGCRGLDASVAIFKEGGLALALVVGYADRAEASPITSGLGSWHRYGGGVSWAALQFGLSGGRRYDGAMVQL